MLFRSEQAEADALTRGRAELTAITERNLPNAETARLVREVYGRFQSRSVRQSARRLLAQLNDPQSVPMLIEGLSTTPQGRAQAALGLAEIGSPAADPARAKLMEVLPSTTVQTDRVEVAWALVVLGEGGAWTTIRELLETNKLQQVQGLNQRRIFDQIGRASCRERV